MNELLDVFIEKLRKPFWRAFSISWLTWNWQIWYLTIFVNSDIVWNKLEYIIKKYSYFYDFKSSFEIYWINFYKLLFPEIWIIIHWFIIPLWLSWLVVWHFPKITNKYLEKNKKTREEENRIMKEEIESETKVLEAKKENLEKKEEIDDIKEKNKHKEWDKDYEIFILNYPNILNLLSIIVYDNNGFTSAYKANEYWLKEWISIDYKMEQILDVHNLIIRGNEKAEWNFQWKYYEITEKWKYFLKKYSQEKK